MPSATVLVVEDEVWICRLLALSLEAQGYHVVLASTGREGLRLATSIDPSCVVIDVGLPDVTGYWVAQQIRTQPTAAATVPILFLTSRHDTTSRLAGFHVGADAYLTKPFRVEEVVAQIDALVAMSQRLRGRREHMVEGLAHAARGVVLSGVLAEMSVATVLSLLELEKRTGRLSVTGGDAPGLATFDVGGGLLLSASLDGAPCPPLEALSAALLWKAGSFSFSVLPEGTSSSTPEPGEPISMLLLEALRLHDESEAGGEAEAGPR